MNKLEGRLVRSISKSLGESVQQNLIVHYNKANHNNISFIGKRIVVNIIANALSKDIISIDDFNKYVEQYQPDSKGFLVKAMIVTMINAIAFARHELTINLRTDLEQIKQFVCDEVSIKKELLLKGWVTAVLTQTHKYVKFVAISTGGDCFVFDGSAKCRYYIWNFQENNFKLKQNKTGA
jgi:hypothetical protein